MSHPRRLAKPVAAIATAVVAVLAAGACTHVTEAQITTTVPELTGPAGVPRSLEQVATESATPALQEYMRALDQIARTKDADLTGLDPYITADATNQSRRIIDDRRSKTDPQWWTLLRTRVTRYDIPKDPDLKAIPGTATLDMDTCVGVGQGGQPGLGEPDETLVQVVMTNAAWPASAPTDWKVSRIFVIPDIACGAFS